MVHLRDVGFKAKRVISFCFAHLLQKVFLGHSEISLAYSIGKGTGIMAPSCQRQSLLLEKKREDIYPAE